jgi:hypothetical protein
VVSDVLVQDVLLSSIPELLILYFLIFLTVRVLTIEWFLAFTNQLAILRNLVVGAIIRVTEFLVMIVSCVFKASIAL